MRLAITHETRYDYSSPVQTAHHLAWLCPRVHPGLTLLDHQLAIDPTPTHSVESLDAWGNPRRYFCCHFAHRSLSVCAHSVVQTQTSTLPVASGPRWADSAQALRYARGRAFDAASLWMHASPRIAFDAAYAAYGRQVMSADMDVQSAALALMQRIHADFEYDSSSTLVDTPVSVAFAQRRGVCQDFAHIFIAVARSLGLAACYVSGYLLTQPPPGQPRLRGSDASHAWAAVYMAHWLDVPPEQRWLHLDPTNNRAGTNSPGADYVVLALGRDFGDVSPLRGVLRGGGAHTLTVGVTVEPIEAPQSVPRLLSIS